MNKQAIMKKALRLAAQGRGSTSPNPMVGAILMRGDEEIATGWHRRAGTPHAEALALQRAGALARGTTLYVTLEPCCHTDKKTPPCAQAIIAAGVREVVIAMEDPNPKVSGKGSAMLRAAGIAVETGVLEDSARLLNEVYIKYITTGLPFVYLKTAMTLDGKIATPTGESQWITGEKARAHVHRVRSRVDAIVTAIGTVLADNPQMTARVKGRALSPKDQPLCVVIDPDLEITLNAKVLRYPPETLIVTRERNAKADILQAHGARFLHFEDELRMPWLMAELGRMGITSVLIEGGGSLNWRALNEGVVDHVMFFVAPKIIGGRDSVSVVGGSGFRPLPEAIMIERLTMRRFGPDVLLEGRVVHQ